MQCMDFNYARLYVIIEEIRGKEFECARCDKTFGSKFKSELL